MPNGIAATDKMTLTSNPAVSSRMREQRFGGRVGQVAGGNVTNVYRIVVNISGGTKMSVEEDEARKLIRDVAQSIVSSIRYVMPEPNWAVIELGKAATAAKRAGDWNEAIACLMLLRDVHNEHTTRLPLYLCEAGRWDEGMREFEALLASAGERTRIGFAGVPYSDDKSKFFWHGELATVYDKMRVACKRAKRIAEAARYQALANEHDAERARRFALLQEADEKRFAEVDARREQLRARNPQPQGDPI